MTGTVYVPEPFLAVVASYLCYNDEMSKLLTAAITIIILVFYGAFLSNEVAEGHWWIWFVAATVPPLLFWFTANEEDWADLRKRRKRITSFFR